MISQIETCVLATSSTDFEGARKVYEASFPEAELFPWEQYQPYFEDGYALLHVTRLDEQIITMSIIECLEGKFLLAYLATAEGWRNQRLGTAHLDALRGKLAERDLNAVIYLEVEDYREETLDEADREIRQRRENWYLNMHEAQIWPGKYEMPHMNDKRKSLPARLMALSAREVTHEEFVDAGVEIMTTSYELSANHRLVKALGKQR